MISNRKRQRRPAEATGGVKQQSPRDSEDQPGRPPRAIHPPKRNVSMLSISSLLFVMWILFLAYVALFG